MANIVKYKAPTLLDLIADKDMAFAQDDLNLILNTPVPQSWVKTHPMVTITVNGQNVPLPYIPIKRVKYLLKRIYGKYEWEIKSCQQILNAVVIVGKLTITNPVTGERESQDGVGATAIQMNKGATQGDLSAIKANAIQIGAPAAESYALKNAAEKFGDIFGGNIYDVDSTAYTSPFGNEKINVEDLQDLYDSKKDVLSEEDKTNAERIINNKETNSYLKLQTYLLSK